MEPEDPPRKNYEMTSRQFERLNAPPGSKADKTAAHDIHAMLRHNRAHEKRTGLDEVALKPVKSRRRRDYWLVLAGVNSLLLTAAALGHDNVVVLVFALAGVVLSTCGITWIMWFVMDDY